MVFCNKDNKKRKNFYETVTILILIDGFLQYHLEVRLKSSQQRHNPYFNRWFSAIPIKSDECQTMFRSQSLF